MNDDITNNTDYEPEEVLNEIDGKDGEPLDAIEADVTEDETSKEALADGISGNDDNAQDKPLNEENY